MLVIDFFFFDGPTFGRAANIEIGGRGARKAFTTALLRNRCCLIHAVNRLRLASVTPKKEITI